MTTHIWNTYTGQCECGHSLERARHARSVRPNLPPWIRIRCSECGDIEVCYATETDSTKVNGSDEGPAWLVERGNVACAFKGVADD